MFQAEIFVRLSVEKGGKTYTVNVPCLGKVSNDEFERVFEAAHQNEDGSPPTPAQCGNDGQLFAAARALRAAEDELKKLVEGGDR